MLPGAAHEHIPRQGEKAPALVKPAYQRVPPPLPRLHLNPDAKNFQITAAIATGQISNVNVKARAEATVEELATGILADKSAECGVGDQPATPLASRF